MADDEMGNSNGTTPTYANGSSTSAVNPHVPGATNGLSTPAKATNGTTNGAQAKYASPSAFQSHNREEVTRILIQALTDLGYHDGAASVCQQSGFDLENQTVAAFRSAVLRGQWDRAEELLGGAATTESAIDDGNGLVLSEGVDKDTMRFRLRQQKYLEQLERDEAMDALETLRTKLTPLGNPYEISFLAGLLMIQSIEELKSKAEWDGARGQSRRLLLSELSKSISPSVMLPENRLGSLLQQARQNQIDSCLYHTQMSAPSLYSNHVCDRRNFPNQLAVTLNDYREEIWQIKFSNDGTRLAVCGLHENVLIFEVEGLRLLQRLEGHTQGVGNICWSPNDSMLVTCSMEKIARVWDTKNGHLLKRLPRFEEAVSSCVWAPDSTSLVLGTLGCKEGICEASMRSDGFESWGKNHRVQDLCGDDRWLVAVDECQTVYVYNRETRDLEYEVPLESRPTSISISKDSQHLLINSCGGELHLFDLFAQKVVQRYIGHSGGRYMIRSSFGGADESFVISGSEDGDIFIWHKTTGQLVERFSGHTPRCNVVAWSPTDPFLIVSGGDDFLLKFWCSPSRRLSLRAAVEASRGSA